MSTWKRGTRERSGDPIYEEATGPAWCPAPGAARGGSYWVPPAGGCARRRAEAGSSGRLRERVSRGSQPCGSCVGLGAVGTGSGHSSGGQSRKDVGPRPPTGGAPGRPAPPDMAAAVRGLRCPCRGAAYDPGGSPWILGPLTCLSVSVSVSVSSLSPLFPSHLSLPSYPLSVPCSQFSLISQFSFSSLCLCVCLFLSVSLFYHLSHPCSLTFPLSPGCGYSFYYNRVMGGKQAWAKKWPWQASIQKNDVHICAGSIVASLWVLTAASCMNTSSNLTVYLGNPLLSVEDRVHSRRVPVKQVIIHPYYQEKRYWSWIGRENNVALLKLAQRLNYSEYIAPVCLPSPNLEVKPGSFCWVTGWGQYKMAIPNYPIPLSKDLIEAEIMIMSNDDCDTLYHDISEVPSIVRIISPNMLCSSYYRGRNVCYGDDGSPLVCEIDNTWFQIGTVSWTLGCIHQQTPGVYSRISKYVTWIQNEIAELNYAVSTFMASSWFTHLFMLLPISLIMAL
ncbi:probable threonine protease PRSS50 [Petaurus breviceps papuanus]|uniref:probable threonine protease PRSS50 n=1 Tax=Petaurus breviceps papuanus TaxID=3040969 RepID=UPI0036DA956A